MSDVQVELPSAIIRTSNVASDWSKSDTTWVMSLFGTAIGAGVLFLPINAGASGLLPLLFIAVLAYPMTYFSHRTLSRFILSSSGSNTDITEVAKEHFGAKAGLIVTFLYIFAILPILLMYSVAITNTVESFLLHQLHIYSPPRAVLSAMILSSLMLIISVGQESVLKAMSSLVYPFILSLLLLSLYLLPHWDLRNWAGHFFIKSPDTTLSFAVVKCLWFLIPLIVFSFNHSPIISSFSQSQRENYGAYANEKASMILRRSHLLMIATVMFFVVSCVLSLTPVDLALARKENISILSYIANHFQSPLIAYAVPLIAFVAISKSFLGHYLGAREGLLGLIVTNSKRSSLFIKKNRLGVQAIDIAIILLCWITATLNPSILGMIETLGGPVIAVILSIMPVYALYTIPALSQYRMFFRDAFILLAGLIAMSARLCYFFS